MLSNTLISIILPIFARAASAQSNIPTAAGIGRHFGTGDLFREAIFSISKLVSSVDSIVASLTEGNNRTKSCVLPVEKVYGVNIGNWLLFEPWMAPAEWISMGGQFCAGACSNCRQSEWSLSEYLGREQTNAAFKKHWETWFTQDDVDRIVDAGMNTVRIPLGFWVVEDLVDTATEPYAQGGLDELIRGLDMFKEAGIYVVLDHHALPGVSSKNQMFAGNCTPNIQFYDSPNDYNYKRAVTWSVVMAWLSHVHPAFETVFAIEAINEPEQSYSLTPGLDRYEKSFVLAIRTLELSLGIICDISFIPSAITDTLTLQSLKAAVPIIIKLAEKYGLGLYGVKSLVGLWNGGPPGLGGFLGHWNPKNRQGHCLSTTFMDRDWQYLQNGTVPNPANTAHGPQLYDNHLYFNFGGVAAQDPDSYMRVICNYTGIMKETAIGNAPIVTGEWAISTAFPTNDTFLRQWGDAQKLAYSQGAGWMFWNWKVDPDATVPQQKMWSYRDALASGVVTRKPQEYFDPNVCTTYFNS